MDFQAKLAVSSRFSQPDSQPLTVPSIEVELAPWWSRSSKNRKLRDRSGSTKGRAPTVHGRSYMLNGRSHAPTMTCIKDWKRSYVAAVFSCKESWYFHMPRSKCCQKPWAKIQGKRRQRAKQMILGIISCTEVSTNHTEMVKANEDVSHHIDNINIYKSRIINGSIQDVCQQGSKKVWCDIQSKLRTVNKANSWCCLLLVPFWNILAYLCHGCNSSRSLACQSFKQACDHLWHLFAGFFCLNWVSVLVASPHGEKTIPGK